jgi:hypothetical protein
MQASNGHLEKIGESWFGVHVQAGALTRLKGWDISLGTGQKAEFCGFLLLILSNLHGVPT